MHSHLLPSRRSPHEHRMLQQLGNTTLSKGRRIGERPAGKILAPRGT